VYKNNKSTTSPYKRFKVFVVRCHTEWRRTLTCEA